MVDQNPTLEDRVNTPNGLSQLITKRYVNIFDLQPEDIDLDTIAHSLARTCRFNGQVAGFLSVAGHSIGCALRAVELDRRDLALECLMHDAAEAYTGDLVRPIKHHPDFKQVYLNLESGIEEHIAANFGLQYPFDPFIKEMDDAEVTMEMNYDRFDPLRWDEPNRTKKLFIDLFNRFYTERNVPPA